VPGKLPGFFAAFFPKARGNRDVLDNTAYVREIPEGLTPQIIVTPSGEWLTDIQAPQEQSASNDPSPAPSEKWERRVRYMFTRYSDSVAVGADIHFPDRPPVLPDWTKR